MKTESLVAETLVKINNLRLAFQELEKHWNHNEEKLHFLENEYPFDHDFSELTNEVNCWYNYQTKYLGRSFTENKKSGLTEFVNTKQFVPINIFTRTIGGELYEGDPLGTEVLVYANHLGILKRTDGLYYLILNNQDWLTKDLRRLERKLYNYFKCE